MVKLTMFWIIKIPWLALQKAANAENEKMVSKKLSSFLLYYEQQHSGI
jgi:hypothetical protein